MSLWVSGTGEMGMEKMNAIDGLLREGEIQSPPNHIRKNKNDKQEEEEGEVT